MTDGAPDIARLKAGLRQTIASTLGSMLIAERAAHAEAVTSFLRGAAGDGPVLVFLPDAREPAIDPLIGDWISAGRDVLAPRCDWDAGVFTPVRLRSLVATEVRRHGVREPVAADDPAPAPAAVLVPGVAFDAAGGRLGRGGGFYDRSLAALPAGVRLIGVCFACQLVERVPREPHDALVHAVVTERGILESA